MCEITSGIDRVLHFFKKSKKKWEIENVFLKLLYLIKSSRTEATKAILKINE